MTTAPSVINGTVVVGGIVVVGARVVVDVVVVLVEVVVAGIVVVVVVVEVVVVAALSGPKVQPASTATNATQTAPIERKPVVTRLTIALILPSGWAADKSAGRRGEVAPAAQGPPLDVIDSDSALSRMAQWWCSSRDPKNKKKLLLIVGNALPAA
jgi:hypothetical protein